MALSTKYYYSDQTKVNEIGESCSAHVVDDKCTQMFCWKA
jgi:hypothetical protein